MITSVLLGTFVLGAVLLLVALTSGPIEIFGAKVPATSKGFPKIIAGVLGTVLIVTALWKAFPVDHNRSVPPPDPSFIKTLSPHDCNEEPSLKSIQTVVSTTVTFSNRSSIPVTLYWINFDGKRRSQGTLKPGDSITMQTYYGHPFVLTDSSDECLGIFLPSEEPARATFGKK